MLTTRLEKSPSVSHAALGLSWRGSLSRETQGTPPPPHPRGGPRGPPGGRLRREHVRRDRGPRLTALGGYRRPAGPRATAGPRGTEGKYLGLRREARAKIPGPGAPQGVLGPRPWAEAHGSRGYRAAGRAESHGRAVADGGLVGPRLGASRRAGVVGETHGSGGPPRPAWTAPSKPAGRPVGPPTLPGRDSRPGG